MAFDGPRGGGSFLELENFEKNYLPQGSIVGESSRLNFELLFWRSTLPTLPCPILASSQNLTGSVLILEVLMK